MVVRYNDILTLITHLGDEEGLVVTVKESLKVNIPIFGIHPI